MRGRSVITMVTEHRIEEDVSVRDVVASNDPGGAGNSRTTFQPSVVGEPVFRVCVRGAGAPKKKGAAPWPERPPCGDASADQLCQRNSCCLRTELWEIRTLTRAGPLKAIASSSAALRSFGSSTKIPLPPKASIILS